MRKEFEQFNSEHVGEDNVFPTKNGAPKILEQFKDKPYTLELRDEFTTGIKPATCKVLEHFVRTTPVVEKCDDPRCFSRLVIVPKREPGHHCCDRCRCRDHRHCLANCVRVLSVNRRLIVYQFRRYLTNICVSEIDLLCYPHCAPQLGGRN